MVFDYIIIGAGSSGCVLANRLSEDPSCNVLLLEAGGKANFKTSIPGAYSTLHNTSVDWAFYTEPQSQLGNRKLFVPRGKVLGGCSTTNAMAYVRGNPEDYNEWVALGNQGWSFSDVLPYFKKSEHHEVLNGTYHNQTGPLYVSFAKYPSPISKLFIEACVEKGIPYVNDYNGETQLGTSMLQFTIKNNKRQSCATAFLQPIKHRQNLTVRTKALVSRIVIEHDKAVGVELITGRSTTETIRCQKEVIVSAGTIKTPQLLMLSGIGDETTLKKAGIEVKLNLPGVGQNLHDHVWTYAGNLSDIPTANHDIRPFNQVKGLLKYLLFNKGPFCNSPIEANAFLKTEEASTRPDIQFHFAPFYVGVDYKTDLYDIKTFPKTNGFGIMAILLHPQSRGCIGLQTNNPMHAPIIEANFLQNEKDRSTLLKGLKKAMEVADAEAFRSCSKGLQFPNKHASDEMLMDHISKSLETLYHPVGTCKMGNDALSVVNEKLQVHGIKGLRVIDASIMPTIISGNTNAACIMIAEKAADMIKTASL